jgi:hypothetical protein
MYRYMQFVCVCFAIPVHQRQLKARHIIDNIIAYHINAKSCEEYPPIMSMDTWTSTWICSGRSFSPLDCTEDCDLHSFNEWVIFFSNNANASRDATDTALKRSQSKRIQDFATLFMLAVTMLLNYRVVVMTIVDTVYGLKQLQ